MFAHAVPRKGIDEKRFFVDMVVEVVFWLGYSMVRGPRDATSTPPTPARGGDDGIEAVTPRATPLRWSWTLRTAMRMIADARTLNRLKIVAA